MKQIVVLGTDLDTAMAYGVQHGASQMYFTFIGDENEEENIKAVGKHEYIIEGSTNLDDLNDSLDLNLESEDYDSLGGFIIEKLDRLPKAGDSVSTEEGIRMVVEKLDKNRIETVHLYLPENYREHTSDSLETDD